MMGTFGGALEARGIDASGGRLTADVRGEVEVENNVLVLKRVHVALKLRTEDPDRDAIERAHRVFADKCPVYRSLREAIQITSSYEVIT